MKVSIYLSIVICNICITYKVIYIIYILITVACLLQQCPPGTICKHCEETNETYCEYSCAIDNGGCPEGSQCAEDDVLICNHGQCCSHVNITCSGNCIINDNV